MLHPKTVINTVLENRSCSFFALSMWKMNGEKPLARKYGLLLIIVQKDRVQMKE